MSKVSTSLLLKKARESQPRVQSLLVDGKKALAKAGLADPALEARVLLSGLLKCTPTQLYLMKEAPLSMEVREAFWSMIVRRARFEPVAYILGEQNFLGRLFSVDPRVLIPRPETEIMVEMAAAQIKEKSNKGVQILDVGTGSGCIAITLALLFPKARVVAVDISEDALVVARKNAERHGVTGRLRFLTSDLFAGLSKESESHFDMIISNPPYVKTSELNQLDPDLKYEPRLALDGGSEGMSILKRLIEKASFFLKSDGLLVLEIGCALAEPVASALRENGFASIRLLKDHAGLDRIAMGRRRGPV